MAHLSGVIIYHDCRLCRTAMHAVFVATWTCTLPAPAATQIVPMLKLPAHLSGVVVCGDGTFRSSSSALGTRREVLHVHYVEAAGSQTLGYLTILFVPVPEFGRITVVPTFQASVDYNLLHCDVRICLLAIPLRNLCFWSRRHWFWLG